MPRKILIVLFSLLFLTLTQDIIDFSITDQLEKTFSSDYHDLNVNIECSGKKGQYLKYPQACFSIETVQEQSVMETEERHLIEQQKQLTVLKSNLKQLLAVAEKIKSNKRLLNSLNEGMKLMKNTDFELSHQDMIELELLQQQLSATNSTISEHLASLRSLILHEFNRTKKNQFDQIRLKFQLEIYRSRLQYLLVLQTSLPHNSSDKNFDSLLHELFGNVREGIKSQQLSMETIQRLLEGFSGREELKIKISNLQNQIEGLNLMIEDKNSCDQKKGEMNNRQNKKEFEAIYNQLKQLKSHETSKSEYCEGVSKILERQLKKILRVYNYSFACSEGLEDIKKAKINLQIELNELKKLQQLDDSEMKNQELRSYFQNEVKVRKQLENKIANIEISHHQFDINILEAQIQETKSLITKISDQLDNPPENYSPPVDYTKIREMIGVIEEQQLQYCQLKDEYTAKYNNYEVGLKSIEHRASLSRHSLQIYLEQVAKLTELETQFEQTRRIILSQLK